MRLQSKIILLLLTISIAPLVMAGFVIYKTILNETVQQTVLDSLLLFGFIIITTMVALSIFIARTITKPVRNLNLSALEVAGGNLEIEMPEIRSDDEIGELGKSFKEMVAKLKESLMTLNSSNQQLKAANQQLRASNQQLEASTQQLRTANQQLAATEKNLKEKIRELEIFNKTAVGRELKMIELKKEIELLQKKLNTHER